MEPITIQTVVFWNAVFLIFIVFVWSHIKKLQKKNVIDATKAVSSYMDNSTGYDIKGYHTQGNGVQFGMCE